MEKYGYVLTQPTPEILAELGNPELTQDQINNALSRSSLRWTTHRKVLWSLMATRRVVFMGFSIEDPYFLEMLNMIKDDLNTYNDEVHMAVFRLGEGGAVKALETEKELRKFGIECVFFDDDKTYSGFAKFLNEISASVSTHSSILMNNAATVAIAEPGKDHQEPPAHGKQELPNWMNDQNKALSKEIRHEN